MFGFDPPHQITNPYNAKECGLHVSTDSLLDSAHVAAAEPNKEDSRVATFDAGLLPSHYLSQHLTQSVTSTSTTPWAVSHSVDHAMTRSHSVTQPGTVLMPGPFGNQERGPKETFDLKREGYPIRSHDSAPDNYGSRSAFWTNAAVQETYTCEDYYGYGTPPSTRGPLCQFPASSRIQSSTDVGSSVTIIVDDTRPAVSPVPGIAVNDINSPGPRFVLLSLNAASSADDGLRTVVCLEITHH